MNDKLNVRIFYESAKRITFDLKFFEGYDLSLLEGENQKIELGW